MRFGTTCAIVPVKVLAQAKRRLSSVLPDAVRPSEPLRGDDEFEDPDRVPPGTTARDVHIRRP